jgi:cobalt/nickel transport system permease protein
MQCARSAAIYWAECVGRIPNTRSEDRLRHASLARWSTQNSFVHEIDARVKLILLLAFVVVIALIARPSALQLSLSLAALILITWTARLPVWRILRTSLLVVPFVGLFAVIVYLTGDAHRAWSILSKSYLSGLSVLILAASTPLPEIATAAHFFRVPALLVEVIQLIYRYLFVLTSEARTMQTAFATRSGHAGATALRASSGMVAVLFSRSYEKAAIIHSAMRSRGFSGEFAKTAMPGLTSRNFGVALAGLSLITALYFA